jgi:hypothetical protein
MCRRKMIRKVSRVGGWEGLSIESILGFMSEVMRAWVRVWGVHVRLMMTIGMIPTCVSGHCERSAFVSGVYFSLMRWRVSF